MQLYFIENELKSSASKGSATSYSLIFLYVYDRNFPCMDKARCAKHVLISSIYLCRFLPYRDGASHHAVSGSGQRAENIDVPPRPQTTNAVTQESVIPTPKTPGSVTPNSVMLNSVTPDWGTLNSVILVSFLTGTDTIYLCYCAY
jgi:hypothetical protein